MNERKARQLVKGRSGGDCEVCGQRRATDMHHRKNRSQGGTWTPSNLLHLDHEHHMHITSHPQASREQGWSVPSYLDPLTAPVWIARLGWVFLDDHGNYENEEAA